jgi:hypothetical protein
VKTLIICLVTLPIVMITLGATALHAEVAAHPTASAAILLLPGARIFTLDEVQRGAVGFTAVIKNEGTAVLTVAHPSICVPLDYKWGETRRLGDSHGKSEILLKITKPDGSNVVLRDGCFYYFDPYNIPVIAIPPGETGSFHVGWFFQNARGRWERDDKAANLFMGKGKYKVSILLRNVFPHAVLYDESTRETRFVDVWTGERESPEVTIEVK